MDAKSTSVYVAYNVRAIVTMTAAQITEARDWLKDCYWGDMDPEDFDDISSETVIRAIARFYDGGVAGFLTDCTPNN